uniref:Uncharacterized protein n=2 Tax=Schistocephalus solidus TaxID=70667 RepID=A0A0X3NPB5_SCHSO
MRQCRSLEAELVSSRARIARLEAECSGLKVTSDQVIKNFAVIKYASRATIIQLKKEIRAHLRRSGHTTPACSRDHSKCLSVPILNPCHPLESKDVLEYFDAVTSFCDCSSSKATQEKNPTSRPTGSRVSPNSTKTALRECHENASRASLQKPGAHTRSLSSSSSSSSTGSSTSSGSSYSSSAASGPSNQPSRHATIPRTSRETEPPVQEKPSTRLSLSRGQKEGNEKLRDDVYWEGCQAAFKRYDSPPRDDRRRESYERPRRLSPENHHVGERRSRLQKPSTDSINRRHTRQSEKSRSSHAEEDTRKLRDVHTLGAVKVSHKQTPHNYDTGVYQRHPQVSLTGRVEPRGSQRMSSYSPPPDQTIRPSRATEHPVSDSRAYPRTQIKDRSRHDKTEFSERNYATNKDLGRTILTSPNFLKNTTQSADGTSVVTPVPSSTADVAVGLVSVPPDYAEAHLLRVVQASVRNARNHHSAAVTMGVPSRGKKLTDEENSAMEAYLCAEEQHCLQRLSSSSKSDVNPSDGRPKSATLFTKRQIAKQKPTPHTSSTPTPSPTEPAPPQPPPEASDKENLERPRQVSNQPPNQEMIGRAEDEVTPVVATTQTTTETRRENEGDTDSQHQQVPLQTVTDPSQFIYEDIINAFDAEEEKEGDGKAAGSKAISGIGDSGEGDGMPGLDADFDICLAEPKPRPSGRPRTPDEPGGDEEAHYEQLGRDGDEDEEVASSDDQASGPLNSLADVVVVGEVAEEDAGATATTEERDLTTRSGRSELAQDRSYSPGFDRAESPRIDVEEVTPEDADEKLVEELEDGEELTDGEADLEDEEEEEAAETDEEGDRGRPAKRPRHRSLERSVTSRRDTSSRKHTDSFNYSESSDGGAGADDSGQTGHRNRSRPRNSMTPHTRQFRHSERERQYSGGGPRERSPSDLRPHPCDNHLQTHSSRARKASPSVSRRKHSEFRGSSDTLLSAPPPVRRAAVSPARYAQPGSVNRRYRPTAPSHGSGSNTVKRHFPRPSERSLTRVDHDKRSLPLRASVAYRKPPVASDRPREAATGSRYSSQSTRDSSLSHRRISLNNRLPLMDRNAVRRSSALKNSHNSARTGSRFVRR